MEALSNMVLSDLIGAIYDCAIMPERWPHVLEQLCGELECILGAIIEVDLKHTRVQPLIGWNDEFFSAECRDKYPADICNLFMAASMSPDPDEPVTVSRTVDAALYQDLPYYTQLVKPLGICDLIVTTTLRKPNTIGGLALNRHERAGVATDREIAVMRLIAPHLRRALNIGDLLDRNTVFNRSLAASLDLFDFAVIAVGPEGRILHANAAAEAMFAAGGPVLSAGGKLSACGPETANELLQTIALAQMSDASVKGSGWGAPLRGPNGEAAIAHILPIAHSVVRQSIAPRASAMVFVSMADRPRAMNYAGFARQFGLTASETRVVQCIVGGAAVAQVAETLGVSEPTVRTHLQRIFLKTGASNQTRLIKLAGSVIPPVRPAQS